MKTAKHLDFSKVSEIKLVYKNKVAAKNRIKVTNPKMVYNALMEHWDDDKIDFVEQFKVMILNQANDVLGILELSSGTSTTCIVDVKLIVYLALRTHAQALIVTHNHPSGNLKPSQQDIEITKKIQQACKLMDISFLDHVIVTRNGFYSFSDEGLL